MKRARVRGQQDFGFLHPVAVKVRDLNQQMTRITLMEMLGDRTAVEVRYDHQSIQINFRVLHSSIARGISEL